MNSKAASPNNKPATTPKAIPLKERDGTSGIW